MLAFNQHGTAYFDEPTAWGTLQLLRCYPLVERIPFDGYRELLPLYDDAIAADAKFIDTSTRLYWNNGLADLQRLKSCKKHDDFTIAAKKAGPLIRANGYMYRLALL